MSVHRQRKKYDFCDADSLARTNLGFLMWLAREIGQILPIFFGQKIPKFEKFRARIYWDYGGSSESLDSQELSQAGVCTAAMQIFG